ncbi:DUF1330 domain-containing protein [Georgenia sp. EYE_87]|uniref:DUF1330 domain-containing protein n=1 Tax=Georgenia sp. EYE_87 TaxID=2853448 RepID=UPI002004A01F|nr:DUF1330 domain-containing protein [Georgenia sp. EYE_87]MCK6210071.1 DUF1330 domain-containing protein [Georgenia sp. EYE_87]
MTAYVIARIREITDPDLFNEYRKQMPVVLAQYGGRYLARGPEEDLLAGSGPEKVAIIEFPSRAAADKFWTSPEYTEVRKLRERSADSKIGVVEGFPL